VTEADVPDPGSAQGPESSWASPDDSSSRPDPVAWTGAAVVLGALAGVCALLGDHLLLGVLRIAAGVLVGLAAGAGLVALRRGRGALLLPAAAVLALAVATALTAPALIAARAPSLDSSALARIAPLGDGDTVVGLGAAGAPVLVRRAAGGGQLLSGTRVQAVESGADEALALSEDGTRLLRTSEAGTTVLDAGGGGEPVALATLPGPVLALAGDVAMARVCEAGACLLTGYDLTEAPSADAAPEPLWQVLDGDASTAPRGPDPGSGGPAAPAIAVGAAPAGLLDAITATGVVPAVPLRFDPAQGWVQLDPTTGFPMGRVLAGPEDLCRIAATDPAPGDTEPVVLTVCAAEDGALTATATRDGEEQWTSDPSPAGEWTVRMEDGRVLASGTEAGTGATGEIVASEAGGAWSRPGGAGIEQASAFTSRVGIDGSRMVVTNEQGQLLAYDTATGENTWSAPLASPLEDLRGDVAASFVAVVTPAPRERSLDPRSGVRVRTIDAASGRLRLDLVVRDGDEVEGVRALGDGRALVTTGDAAYLLGP